MYSVRLFCTRNAALFEKTYNVLENVFIALHPLLNKLGYNRLEKPVATIEALSKSFLFDCKMCGQCVLSSTGMSCPMNCPKNVRNGPCGGVRDGGFCEVNSQMRCVWVEAWNGASKMKSGLERISVVQPPVNRELAGSSSWLRVVREKAELKLSLKQQVAQGDVDLAKTEMANAFPDARKNHPSVAPLANEPQAALAEQAVVEQTSVHTSVDRSLDASVNTTLHTSAPSLQKGGSK